MSNCPIQRMRLGGAVVGVRSKNSTTWTSSQSAQDLIFAITGFIVAGLTYIANVSKTIRIQLKVK